MGVSTEAEFLQYCALFLVDIGADRATRSVPGSFVLVAILGRRKLGLLCLRLSCRAGSTDINTT
jgi:hypothetical protein